MTTPQAAALDPAPVRRPRRTRARQACDYCDGTTRRHANWCPLLNIRPQKIIPREEPS